MVPSPEDAAAAPGQPEPEISILKQRVELNVDFASRSLSGSTEITVQPLIKDIKSISLHCRQCRPTSIQVGGITAKWEYRDPYRRLQMHDTATIHQYDMLRDRVEKSLRPSPQPELLISLPAKLKIYELQLDPQGVEVDGPAAGDTVAHFVAQQGPQFAPIKISIEFQVPNCRDGVHWIGHADGDRRYPYMYTKAEPWPGNSSCIFPCVDDATSRCTWEFVIRAPRTLGDAFRISPTSTGTTSDSRTAAGVVDVEMANTAASAQPARVNGATAPQYSIDLADDEAALELPIVCVGDQVDDVVDADDPSHHTVSFNLSQPVTARHVGFAIGPFEHVDLSAARGSEEEERLGQTAIKVDGYCLPGKSKDLLNTCYPIAWAVDNMAIKYGSFPFSTFQLLFVDDLVYDTIATAGLSFCSSRLLFPKTIIEPLYRNTRILIRALADQWMGVNVVAKEPADEWVVAGVAGFMADAYMKDLCGNNEFRWQQRQAAEKVYELDVDRPSITTLGQLFHIDHTIRDFVNVKSALILFILDRRLMKTTGQTGVQRIINKIFLNARTGALVNGEVSTMDFQRTCERLGHNKLESFFRQWVFQSGCPIFYVTQRFNKKKLVVEMTIVQKQLDRVTKPPFDPSSFMREIKEYVQEVWAPETNPVFTGPMTIRIHEADGTPYEHIVEIKEAITKLEIPYNTKYKRLKRSRKQKERQMAEGVNAEGGEDTLLFCLGDKYQTEDEKREWNLIDWTEEDEEKMGQESYEWIRMDADFEWIGKIHLVMPLYMYVSQLQQDRDIVAQYESMRYLLASNPHHVSLSILVRTLMDDKYFWGIRELAADGLAICAKDRWREIGQFHLMKAFRELFCINGANMPKPNDFSDRRNYVLQCAIPKAMAKLRDEDGKVPMAVRQFFVDLLKFNDNSNNHMEFDNPESALYSDNHYVATLMQCLSDSLIASHRESQPRYTFNFGDEEPLEPEDSVDADFEKLAIAQIERHRRIDEWDPSYQNVYSITSLHCLQQLTKAGIVKDKTIELMQYVRAGNADNVRLAAWQCLCEVGVLRNQKALRYLLHCLADDASPSFRDALLRIFGEALGHIALGDPEPAKAQTEPVPEAGLILEQEPSSEAKRMEATRKTTPEGAMAALQTMLINEEDLKEALWRTITSEWLTMEETAALCDIAALVYESEYSLTVKLDLPRKWRCRHAGQGRMQFIAYGPYRTAPQKPMGLSDWQKMQNLNLKYTGPLSPEVMQHEQDLRSAELRKQIEQTKREIQKRETEEAEKTQSAPIEQTSTAMDPPSTATPSTEKTGFKLSLGPKRKPSISEPRASSPKAPKLSRQQTPTTVAPSPRAKGSPANNARRSSTPSSRASGNAGKRSRIVALKLGDSARKAQEILAAPPKPQRDSTLAGSSQQQSSLPSARSITPTHQHSPLFPFGQSPTNSMNYFEQSAPSNNLTNLGLFRSFAPAADADAAIPESKEVEMNMSASPVVEAAASNGDGVVSPVASTSESAPEKQETPSSNVEIKQEMPPPPRPKLTLKLSSRKNSTEQ